MAATVTFRPKPGIVDALDALGGDRSSHINAALAAYLGVNGDTPPVGAPARSGDESQASNSPSRPRPRRASKKRARQGVPTIGESPECPHPKSAEKKLQFGVQCTECGKMIR